MNRPIRIFLLLLTIFAVQLTHAQDTSKKTIEITSSFKPVLRNADFELQLFRTFGIPDT